MNGVIDLQGAWELASACHSGQLYNGKPYLSEHVQDVYERLLRAGSSKVQLCGGILHDVIEDGGQDKVRIAAVFGSEVASIVDAVSGEGANRSERQLSIVWKLGLNQSAIDVKLADRCSNVSKNIEANNVRNLKMYVSEDGLYAPIFSRGNLLLASDYSKLIAQATSLVRKARFNL